MPVVGGVEGFSCSRRDNDESVETQTAPRSSQGGILLANALSPLAPFVPPARPPCQTKSIPALVCFSLPPALRDIKVFRGKQEPISMVQYLSHPVRGENRWLIFFFAIQRR